MSAKEIGTYIGNGFDKVKEIILAVFGKTVDAYNDYDVVVNVTEHGKGPNEEPTGTRAYHQKYRVNLGNVVLIALGAITVLATAIGIFSIVEHNKK